MEKIKLSNNEKILIILLELTKGTKKRLKFEDIIVKVFKKFPKDFHMKGHAEYPDAESVRRPLYVFKQKGLLSISNMVFSFTDKGIDLATKIKKKSSKKEIVQSDEKNMDRYISKEIARIQKLNSYIKFLRDEEILTLTFSIIWVLVLKVTEVILTVD